LPWGVSGEIIRGKERKNGPGNVLTGKKNSIRTVQLLMNRHSFNPHLLRNFHILIVMKNRGQ
jgi:hypothetical protein